MPALRLDLLNDALGGLGMRLGDHGVGQEVEAPAARHGDDLRVVKVKGHGGGDGRDDEDARVAARTGAREAVGDAVRDERLRMAEGVVGAVVVVLGPAGARVGEEPDGCGRSWCAGGEGFERAEERGEEEGSGGVHGLGKGAQWATEGLLGEFVEVRGRVVSV